MGVGGRLGGLKSDWLASVIIVKKGRPHFAPTNVPALYAKTKRENFRDVTLSSAPPSKTRYCAGRRCRTKDRLQTDGVKPGGTYFVNLTGGIYPEEAVHS